VKCLFVVPDLARAGAEKQATLLARGLQDLGWSVSLVVIKERNDFAEVLAAAAIPVRFLKRRGPLDLGVVTRLAHAIKEASPDVVVSLLFLSNLLSVLAARRLSPRPPLAVSVRASYSATLGPLERLLARLTHRGADLTLFNSRASLREQQEGFLRPRQTAYLPNAIPSTTAQPVRWKERGIKDGPVIVSVGQLARIKGHRLLIEAFATLKGHANAHLVLVGDGPEETFLRKLVAARGLTERITFTGHLADPLPLIAAADVFVQPSLTEGMSNALMEAMALGRCILATRVGAASDMMADGKEGQLVEPNVQGLAAGLECVLEDPSLRARLGEGALKRSQEFSTDRIASDLASILTSLLRSRATRA